MNKYRVAIIGIILCQLSVSQVSKLIDYEKRLIKKIEVGMSADEVKKIIGRPKAIEGGFPQSESMIIEELPDQVGQMNNSTWFYFYDAITIQFDRIENDQYLVNGIEVADDRFEDYKDLDEIVYFDGSIVDPKGREYFFEQDSTKLSILPKDTKKTYFKKGKPYKEKLRFIPIVCVIFDKGTQVVASTKVLFQIFR